MVGQGLDMLIQRPLRSQIPQSGVANPDESGVADPENHKRLLRSQIPQSGVLEANVLNESMVC